MKNSNRNATTITGKTSYTKLSIFSIRKHRKIYQQLQDECDLYDRFLYKCRNQQRTHAWLRQAKELKRLLTKTCQSLDALAAAQDNVEKHQIINVIKQSQVLMEKTRVVIRKVYISATRLLAQNAFVPLCSVLVGSVSRMYHLIASLDMLLQDEYDRLDQDEVQDETKIENNMTSKQLDPIKKQKKKKKDKEKEKEKTCDSIKDDSKSTAQSETLLPKQSKKKRKEHENSKDKNDEETTASSERSTSKKQRLIHEERTKGTPPNEVAIVADIDNNNNDKKSTTASVQSKEIDDIFGLLD